MGRFYDWTLDHPGWTALALLAFYIFMSIATFPPETRCIGFEVEVRK